MRPIFQRAGPGACLARSSEPPASLRPVSQPRPLRRSLPHSPFPRPVLIAPSSPLTPARHSTLTPIRPAGFRCVTLEPPGDRRSPAEPLLELLLAGPGRAAPGAAILAIAVQLASLLSARRRLRSKGLRLCPHRCTTAADVSVAQEAERGASGAGAGRAAQGPAAAHRFCMGWAMARHSRWCPLRTAHARHWWPGCGPWAWSLRHRRHMLTGPSRPNGGCRWPHAYKTTTSTPPRGSTPVTPPRALSGALETLARVRRAAVWTVCLRPASSAWAKRQPTGPWLLQVLRLTSIPTRERADQCPGGRWRPHHWATGTARSALSWLRMVGHARMLDALQPGLRLSAGPAENSSAVRAQILCLQAGADSFFIRRPPGHHGNPDVAADRALFERRRRRLEVPSLKTHGCERFRRYPLVGLAAFVCVA